MRLITLDDIIDTYAKANQRGLKFIVSKFNLNEIDRAKTAFNHQTIQASNWWNIPTIKERWKLKVTGNKNLSFEDFTMLNFLNNEQELKMLSLGCGNCASELKFAEYKNFKEITCCDISEIPLHEASKVAKKKHLNNIVFEVQDANTFSFPENYFDVVYFRASLHHFKNIDTLVGKNLKHTLKTNGILIIDEYVGANRNLFPRQQIQAINQAIKLIPREYRKRFNLNFYKNKVTGPGLIRMKIADPSECVESEKILPSIHQNFKTIYEASYGGNILMMALKDIAHHFLELDEEKEKVLKNLFDFEDRYLETNVSDFVFGIYKIE